MKKRSALSALIVLTILSLAALVFTGCSGGLLNTPQNVGIDVETFKLSWSPVEGARSYEVEISTDEGEPVIKEERKTSHSLEDLSMGDYGVRVRAVNAVTGANSEWSQKLFYHKDYETGCIYTLINNDTEYEVTKAGRGEATKGEVILEDYYKGLPVTTIAAGAFRGKSGAVSGVTKIKVGENVTYIGDGAFNGCTVLTEVDMPSGVTYLGSGAFNRCLALESIAIPKNVTEISDSLFINCNALKNITIDGEITRIGASAFYRCDSLTEFVIPDSVVEIGEAAFSATGLKKVTIGSGLKWLSERLFEKCEALSEIVFSDAGNLETIKNHAFSECDALTSLTLPQGLKSVEYACFFNDDSLESVELPDSVNHVGNGAFTGSKLYKDQIDADRTYVYADDWLIYVTPEVKNSIEKINNETGLKDEVVGIADSVFKQAENLKQVVFPANLKYIGQSAFAECSVLWKVDTANVVEIDEYAFNDCVRLSNPILGTKLKKIGSYAFMGCKDLQNTGTSNSLIPDSVESIGTYAFYDTKLWTEPDEYGVVYAGNWVVGFNYDRAQKRADIELKDGVRGIANYAFYKNEVIASVSKLNNARYVGRGAFYGCTALQVAALNRNLRKLEDYTFYKCESLFRVTLPFFLEEIGTSAFYKCHTLTRMDLSASRVRKIGDYAFYECYNLNEFDFGTQLETIGDFAFYYDYNLTADAEGVLALPDTLVEIGGRAFGNNAAIKEINFGNSLNNIGDYAFAGCNGIEKLAFPDSLETLGSNAFYYCTALKEIEFGGGVKNIGRYAFFNAGGLTALRIPENVTSIGDYAFKGTTGLKQILIPSTVTDIGDHAFYGATAATIYTDAKNYLGGWSDKMNTSFRPIVWGVTLSEDNGYVVSLTVTETTFSNVNAKGGFTAPEREGYDFKGWAESDSATTAKYTASEITSVPVGATVYAVWEKKN